MNNSPAFQFYPEAWLSSPKVAVMTPEQEGGYIRLLCYCWNSGDCSLPDNDDELIALARLSKGGSTNVIAPIKRCFVPHPEKPGFLTNERLQKEIAKQAAWKKKSSNGGKQSSENKRKSKGGSTKPQHSVSDSVSDSKVKNAVVSARADLSKKIGEILGWDKNPNWFGDFSRIESWLNAGWDSELDIIPTIQRLGAGKKQIKTLKYFEQAIADSHASRLQPTPKGNLNGTRQPQLTYRQRLEASLDEGIAAIEDRERAAALAIEGPCASEF